MQIQKLLDQNIIPSCIDRIALTLSGGKFDLVADYELSEIEALARMYQPRRKTSFLLELVKFSAGLLRFYPSSIKSRAGMEKLPQTWSGAANNPGASNSHRNVGEIDCGHARRSFATPGQFLLTDIHKENQEAFNCAPWNWVEAKPTVYALDEHEMRQAIDRFVKPTKQRRPCLRIQAGGTAAAFVN